MDDTERCMLIDFSPGGFNDGKYNILTGRVMQVHDESGPIGLTYDPMSDLEVRAQQDNLSETFYGFDCEYRSPYSVDFRRASEMVKVLRKVEKGIVKHADTFGPIRHASDYILAIANILGIKTFYTRDSEGLPRRKLDANGVHRLVVDSQHAHWEKWNDAE